ncbi:hypothetical protein [Aquisphaera insulae]|uniref:hypothetical protein n=1 Tax=Aquisphaera insulae TaxID=2712864 RepID=UPI0013EA2EDF|nr:hypothetical protein [Aquisphaera insulae]
MAGKARKNPVLANPFFMALLAVSTLFVVTALGYLVAPYAAGKRPVEAGATSHALAGWLDRRGPLLLGLEFVVMLTTGVLAMATEDWFMGRGGGEPPRGG